MVIAIIQPTFLPWCGYMSLIDFVDEVIFLDNVQFDKRSWQQRNRIKTSNGTLTLTVPVITKNLFNQHIKDVKIDYSSSFQKKMTKSIFQNYSKAKYFDDYSKEIFSLLESNHRNLMDLNIKLIDHLCKVLKIKFQFSFSSNLNLKTSKEQLILDICKLKKAKKYISTIGAKNYLNEKNFNLKNNIELSFFEYSGKKHNQLYGKFVSNLSVIDLLFNEGPKSKDILRENFFINKNL
ncbi:WbqC family protein [Candidatus Pelagibacter sp. RS39]|uniref:WbqC family protein n=1 Tax=Candidatus Pelagibacter sp. RS39 TaxID=1977864 RepID=UPI000A168CBC|nr:WbqC family protein [Candidatus Pelagibacter sp. RS39]ARJ47493.1 hypothetical protein B5L73_01500 [Candidatus Pelagibacter sp. RS39]